MDNGRKHATIEAGGKLYNLRLSFNTMVVFEDNIGPMQNHLGAGGKTVVGCRGIIWAGINEYGAQQITLTEAGDICEQYIDEHGFEGLAKKMQEFLKVAGWIRESDAGKNPKAPAPKV